MPKRLSLELEQEVVHLLAKGHSKTEIVRLIGRSRHAVDNVVVREARRVPAPPKEWDPSPARLSMSEREEIRSGLERGESFTSIARLIGRAVSTVSRRGGGQLQPRAIGLSRHIVTLGGEHGVRRSRSSCTVAWRRRSPSGSRSGGRQREHVLPLAPRVPGRSDDVGES